MKICWDNLDGICLTRNGTFRKGSTTYVYKNACINCGEPYLVQKRRCVSLFCGHSCAMIGENNSFFGKRHTLETKEKLSKISSNYKGILAHNYKGNVRSLGLTTYYTCKDTLGSYEEIRKQTNTEILEVKCAYCGRWYAPTRRAVDGRVAAINNLNQGEQRLYCSENCKQACPTYNRKMYPKGFKHTTSREVSTYLRQMVLERDNWTCQICGRTIKEVQLHCHHTDPVRQHPMFQNDMDSCVTLCKDCHKMVHSVKGCRYVDLQCKKEIITVEDRNKPMLY